MSLTTQNLAKNLFEISEKNECKCPNMVKNRGILPIKVLYLSFTPKMFLRGAEISADPRALFSNTDQNNFFLPNFFTFQRIISNNAGRARKSRGFLKGYYVLLCVHKIFVRNFCMPQKSALKFGFFSKIDFFST